MHRRRASFHTDTLETDLEEIKTYKVTSGMELIEEAPLLKSPHKKQIQAPSRDVSTRVINYQLFHQFFFVCLFFHFEDQILPLIQTKTFVFFDIHHICIKFCLLFNQFKLTELKKFSFYFTYFFKIVSLAKFGRE